MTMRDTEQVLDEPDAGVEQPLEPPPSRSRLRRVKSFLARPLIQAFVLAVLAWPFSPSNLTPCFSLDCSWQFMLDHAATAGLPFGTQVVFSYGPLGFLLVPELFTSTTALLSLLFTFCVFVGVFWVILSGLRRSLPAIAAFLLAYVAGSTVTFKGAAVVPSFGLNLPLHAQTLVLLGLPIALTLVAQPDMGKPRRWWVALGVMTAVGALVVPTLGLGFLVLILAASACLRTDLLRVIGWLAGSALVVGIIAWEATGNGPTNVVSFVTRSAELAGGYSAALSLHPHLNTLFVVASVLDGVIVAFVAFWACRTSPRRAQVATGVVTVLIFWLLAKETFVRPDAAHAGFLVAAVPLMVAAYLRSVRSPVVSVGALVLATVLAYVSWTGGTFGTVPQATTGRPDRAATNLLREFRELAAPSRRAYITATSRRTVRNHLAVPPSAVDMMRGHCVDIDPVDTVVLWAYRRIKPCTLPVFQDYAAYTSGLDQLDAKALAGPKAPQEILRRTRLATDEIPNAWDPPLTQLEMECRYRQVLATPLWQLTVRTRDRCGAPVLIKRVEARQGGAVTVPGARPGDEVAATFSLAPSLRWRIANFVMRPPSFCATISAQGGSNTAKFVLGTQANLHILRPASTLGYSAPFAPPSLDTVAVGACSSAASSSRLTVSFYRIRMR